MPTSTAPEPEVLERPGTPAGRRRLVTLVAVTLTALGVVGVAEGARRAPAENEALERCARVATTAVDRAEARLSAMARYIAPQLGMASAELDTRLLQLVARQAPEARRPVDDALRTCRGVDVWLLNSEHRRTRTAYVDLLEAERRRLDRIAVDGEAFYDGYDEVRTLREEADSVTP